MSEKGALMLIHAGLFAAQIGVSIAAIWVDTKLSAVSVAIGGAQAFFPNPFKS